MTTVIRATDFALLPLLLAGSVLPRPAAPDDLPEFVHLRSFTAGGTGCPGGDVHPRLEGGSLSVEIDDLRAQAGPGADLSRARRQCTLLVDLEHPDGWSFSVATSESRGYARLAPGVVGRQRTTFYLSGSAETGSVEITRSGPFDGDYRQTDDVAPGDAPWSPCGGGAPLDLKVSVEVDNSADRRAGGELQAFGLPRVELRWRRCR